MSNSEVACQVAVAYFGQGAAKMLPLPKGSTLVVNMSLATVKEGGTCPAEVGKMLDADVAVYHCKNLHAKVFVVGDLAVVGSSNASRPSRTSLIEAALETTEQETVRSCSDFVKRHCQKKLSQKDVAEMLPFYNPSGSGSGHEQNTSPSAETTRRPLWAVGLSRVDWDDEDTRQADKSRPLAKKDLGNPKKFRLEEFCGSSTFPVGNGKNGALPALRAVSYWRSDRLDAEADGDASRSSPRPSFPRGKAAI